jgi:hypothetical protein
MNQSMLDLYTDYLISSFGPITATGLSRLVDGEVSHDQVTRFLASPAKTSADLWRIVKPLIRQVESPDGLLIIDDSIEEKPYTDENDLICWHWDHSQERAVKGINFLTAFYATDALSLPVAFDLVTKTESAVDAKTGKRKRRSVLTKNARYRMLLHLCVHNQIKFRYILNDSWYSAADNMNFIKLDLKKDFVMPLKANRKVALSEADKQAARYVAVSSLDLPEDEPLAVWLEDVAFALRLAKQVFINKDGSTGTLYLVTSDLTLTYEQMTSLYQKRFRVEGYHKSLKQNASLEKSPTRTERTQQNHFFASVCAYVKLERLKLKRGVNHFALKSKIYLSALKAAYQELVKLEPQPLTA